MLYSITIVTTALAWIIVLLLKEANATLVQKSPENEAKESDDSILIPLTTQIHDVLNIRQPNVYDKQANWKAQKKLFNLKAAASEEVKIPKTHKAISVEFNFRGTLYTKSPTPEEVPHIVTTYNRNREKVLAEIQKRSIDLASIEGFGIACGFKKDMKKSTSFTFCSMLTFVVKKGPSLLEKIKTACSESKSNPEIAKTGVELAAAGDRNFIV